MLYSALRPVIRLALLFFCRDIRYENSAAAAMRGPLMIIANHPNSFLDALIVASRFRHPVHFLARGDFFTQTWQAKLLRLLNMIPIYRLSEGKENMGLNGAAFEQSKAILLEKGIVLIFIEGICVNSHELQPFKKGAVRIAIEYEKENKDPLIILPVGIRYDSLQGIGKQVIVRAGQTIPAAELLPYDEQSKNRLFFNDRLHTILQTLINTQRIHKIKKTNRLNDWLAKAGYLLHRPLYNLVATGVRKKTKGSVFYDSVLFVALLILYPCYLILLYGVLLLIGLPAITGFIIILLHAFLSWFAIQYLPYRLEQQPGK